MRDPFDYSFDLFPDDLIMKSAEARRSRNGWYATLAFVILAALAILLAVNSHTVRTAQEDMGGEKGVLQDGVYYIYAGSGFALPNEVRIPRGIFAYTPGEEPELLVSTEDYKLDVLFPSWNVNSHGLWFVDMTTNSLYRMDLTTRETALVYDLPEAPDPAETAGDMSWAQVLSGEYREVMEASMDYNPCLLLSRLNEEEIILTCHDGAETFYLILDGRTGDVLARETEEPPALNGPKDPLLYETVQRLGLQEGTVTEEEGEVWYAYLAVAEGWLYYTRHWPNENPAIAVGHAQLRAMDVETGESRLISEEVIPPQAVTDGTWFYTCGDRTDCYRLDHTPEGVPTGLTLVEKGI